MKENVSGKLDAVFNCPQEELEFCLEDSFLVKNLEILITSVTGKQVKLLVSDFDFKLMK